MTPATSDTLRQSETAAPGTSAGHGGPVRDFTKASVAPSPPRKRRRSRMLLVPILLVIIAAGAVASTMFIRGGSATPHIDRFVVAPRDFNVIIKQKGELKAAKSTDIKSEVEGRCTIISLIAEGTAVKEGDLLVQLASDQIDDRIRSEELKEANAITSFEAARAELDIQKDRNQSDIRKGELQIELAQLALDQYRLGDWEQKLKDAQIAIDQAKINLDRRTEDFEASKKLLEQKYITQTEYNEDEFNYFKAQWDLEKANKAIEVLETYTHRADLRKKESDLQEATKEADRIRKNADAEETKKQRSLEGAEKELTIVREQLAKLREQKEKTRIVAPTQGFVVYYTGGGGRWMSNEDQIKEGAEVYERQILMQLPDTSQMTVAVRIHEAMTDRLRVGQPATVEIEGFPGRQFTGKVSKIAAIADSQNRWLNPDLKEYETEILLDPSDAALKPGVTAHAEILVGQVEDELAVPVQAFYSKGGKRYVFRDEKGTINAVPVRTGAVSNEWAAIVDGLNEGDRVLLAINDDHKRLIPDDTGPDRRGGGPEAGARRGGQGGRGPGRGGPGGGPGRGDRPGGAGAPQPGAAPAAPSPGGAPVATPPGGTSAAASATPGTPTQPPTATGSTATVPAPSAPAQTQPAQKSGT